MIGIVLRQMGEDYNKNLSTALSKRNNITKTLSYHLFNSIILNVGILFVVYMASIIALAYVKSYSASRQGRTWTI